LFCAKAFRFIGWERRAGAERKKKTSDVVEVQWAKLQTNLAVLQRKFPNLLLSN
jgi:hypothetical protein